MIIVCRDRRILLFERGTDGHSDEYQEWLKDKKNSDGMCMGLVGRKSLFDALMHGAKEIERELGG